jgi:hypothetical protein
MPVTNSVKRYELGVERLTLVTWDIGRGTWAIDPRTAGRKNFAPKSHDPRPTSCDTTVQAPHRQLPT